MTPYSAELRRRTARKDGEPPCPVVSDVSRPLVDRRSALRSDCSLQRNNEGNREVVRDTMPDLEAQDY